MVALASDRGLIGLCENRLDLGGVEIAQRRTSSALFGNVQNTRAQRNGGGFSCRRKSEKCANRCQAAITSTDRTPAFAFAVIEEGKNECFVDVFDAEAIDPSAVVLDCEAQKKTPGVAAGTNRMRREVTLLDRPIAEKNVQQSGQIWLRVHVAPPLPRNILCQRRSDSRID